MKKLFMGLLLAAISGVAHADMTSIAEKTEADAIKTAAKMALNDAQIICVSDGDKTELSSTQFYDFVDRAMFVYRNENGQPVVQFTSTYFDNIIRRDLSITTDHTGKKLKFMSYGESRLSAEKTVNLGTIANPNLQVVPGQWETMYNMTCTPK